MDKYIFGIETSCDDTAIAVVDELGNVASSVISSQVEIHNPFGGIYPELASRSHIQTILPLIDKVMIEANLNINHFKAVAVTRGPGLIGSLLVGINTATALSAGWNLPVIGVNHLRGHLRSVELDRAKVDYPATVLLVSGGHTILAYMEDAYKITLLGATTDDSVGEAYDKVSRMLGLGYPGGPIVDKKAREGNPDYINFPRPMLKQGFDFSFSGLKSSVARYVEKTADPVIENVAASFVEAVMEVLIKKCKLALMQHKSNSLIIVGGVSASPQLRERATVLADNLEVKLYLPPLKWSTDNAAMIALAAWDYINLNIYPPVMPQSRIPLNKF